MSVRSARKLFMHVSIKEKRFHKNRYIRFCVKNTQKHFCECKIRIEIKMRLVLVLRCMKCKDMQKVHFCKQCSNKNVISLNRLKSISIYNKLVCTAQAIRVLVLNYYQKKQTNLSSEMICYISVAGKVVKVTAMGQVQNRCQRNVNQIQRRFCFLQALVVNTIRRAGSRSAFCNQAS